MEALEGRSRPAQNRRPLAVSRDMAELKKDAVTPMQTITEHCSVVVCCF